MAERDVPHPFMKGKLSVVSVIVQRSGDFRLWLIVGLDFINLICFSLAAGLNQSLKSCLRKADKSDRRIRHEILTLCILEV